MFKNCEREAWIGLILLRIGTGAGLFGHGDETSGSVKRMEYLD